MCGRDLIHASARYCLNLFSGYLLIPLSNWNPRTFMKAQISVKTLQFV